MKLIENWKDFPKMWSVRFNTAGTVLLTWMVAAPDQILFLWNQLPDGIKAMIPVKYMPHVTIGLFLAGQASRLIKQNNIGVKK